MLSSPTGQTKPATPSRILITGCAGFTGRHLLAHLAGVAPQATLIGADQHRPARPPANYQHCSLNLLAPQAVEDLVAEARPDLVFHLVGLNKSDEPAAFYWLNVLTTLNLLEALRKRAPDARLLAVGSAAEYGAPAGPEPLSEDARLQPMTVYGASKAAQALLLGSYRQGGPATVLMRPFNLLGPGLPTGLVAAAFAMQVAEREAGTAQGPIRVGNLAARRDFLDVRDAVAAYWLAAIQGEPGAVYNVCSGRAVAIQELLDGLLALARRPIAVEVDPERLQASDVPVSVGDNRRLRALGWQPAISLAQSLHDLLEDCRRRLAL